MKINKLNYEKIKIPLNLERAYYQSLVDIDFKLINLTLNNNNKLLLFWHDSLFIYDSLFKECKISESNIYSLYKTNFIDDKKIYKHAIQIHFNRERYSSRFLERLLQGFGG